MMMMMTQHYILGDQSYNTAMLLSYGPTFLQVFLVTTVMAQWQALVNTIMKHCV